MVELNLEMASPISLKNGEYIIDLDATEATNDWLGARRLMLSGKKKDREKYEKMESNILMKEEKE